MFIFNLLYTSLESECKDSSVPNGHVDGDCKKNVGEICAVECNHGYINITPEVVCRNDYFWHPIPSCLRNYDYTDFYSSIKCREFQD